MERGAGSGVAWVADVACGGAGAGAGTGAWAILAAGPALAGLALVLPSAKPDGFSEERFVRRLAMVPNYA
jgi:hypothetical protein